ncbi:MAG: Stk1 family PASTA domain-containing Ser/Thr kinase, partial [Actinomycetota bacterium]|nr:Stk1 family PASTA domain-containing Ser/Thr kinase [Actinomycetota bacterium]
MSDTPALLGGGRYEVGGTIGRGGMAEVHIGRDVRLGRSVAIKVLRSDLARDPAFQARFRREAQSAASLNHTTIVAVYDTGEDVVNGIAVPFIVMEYVEGSTLRDLMEAGKRLLPERAMEVTASVLTALEYSHRQGIVHRDIKPGNVMLTADGQVKVMDFGIARALADTGAMTQTAAVMGTAQYLSPEQARGEQVDARSDLYSTGCLLYELLTGRPPFTGDSPVSVAYQHVREEPVPPSSVDPEVPTAADTITLKALAKDREDRYQTAAEFRADLERAVHGQPLAGGAPRSSSSSATTSVLGAVGAGAAAGAYGAGRADRTTRMATARGAAPITPGPGRGHDGQGYDYDTAPPTGGGRKVALALAALAVFALALFLGVQALQMLRGNGTGTTDVPTVTTVAVPRVTGLTQAQAKDRLEQAGLQAQVASRRASDEPEDTVLDQDPAASEQVERRSVVNLVVSDGPAKVTVPQLVNLNIDAATKALQERGLQVGGPREVNSNQRANTVVSADPKSGQSVEPGST